MTDFDLRIFDLVYRAAAAHPSLLLLMAALTCAGSGWTLVFALPLLARTQTRRLGVALVATLASTSLVVFTLKQIVGRARPCRHLAGVEARVFAAPTDFSFPSGHAAGAFAFAAFVAVGLLAAPATRSRARWAVVCLVSALAGAVAISRVALGVHFPADVAAGALLGAALGGLGGCSHVRQARSAERQRLQSAAPSTQTTPR